MRLKNIGLYMALVGFLFLAIGGTIEPILAAEPGIDINSRWCVATWTHGTSSVKPILYHSVMIVDHDGISSDGTSHIVTVAYPNAEPTKTLTFSYRLGKNKAKYFLQDTTADLTGNPNDYTGYYTYKVTRVADGASNEATDYLSVDPVGPPQDKTTSPPEFDWTPVGGASHYRVQIYDSNNRWLYTGYAKSPPYELPPGILKPNETYMYEIFAIREHQWFEEDNIGASSKITFTTGPDEPVEPYVDLFSLGVYTVSEEPLWGTYTFFYAKIHDAQGVPGDIDYVKALFPDGTTEITLYPDRNETPTRAVYLGMYFGPIQIPSLPSIAQ